VSTLVENLSNIFADVVQYNKDNRFTSEIPPLVIEDLCSVMVNESIGTYYDRYVIVKYICPKVANLARWNISHNILQFEIFIFYLTEKEILK
jgi:hypothetical protein